MLTIAEKKKLNNRSKFRKTNFSEKPVKPIIDIYEKLTSGSETIKRSGRAILVCCPFHGESHPSCALYEETNSFHCFACKESGDYITFTMKLLNVDFKDALEIIKRL